MSAAHRPEPTSRTAASPASLAASTTSANIPNVRAIIEAHADPIDRNEAFNGAYQSLAGGIQRIIGTTPGVRPNWFAVGAYASPQVGRAMVAAERTLEAIDYLRHEPGASARARVFEEMSLDGPSRRLATSVAATLDVITGPTESTAIAAFVAALIATDRATSTSALIDPRLSIAVANRIWNLIKPQGSWLGSALHGVRAMLGFDANARDEVLDNLARLSRTYRTLLAEGNLAIFGDIGRSAEAFLRLDARREKLSPDDVLADLRLPHSTAVGARRVFEFALEHVDDQRPPTDFMLLSSATNDLVRAAFALYALAGETRDLQRKNALISFGNNLIAWREQFETVQPAFTGRNLGEMDRSRVLSALTPVVQVGFDGFSWTFARYARGAQRSDHNPLTAPASEFNWAKFPDRWPAILDSFATFYRHTDRGERWRYPDPSVR